MAGLLANVPLPVTISRAGNQKIRFIGAEGSFLKLLFSSSGVKTAAGSQRRKDAEQLCSLRCCASALDFWAFSTEAV